MSKLVLNLIAKATPAVPASNAALGLVNYINSTLSNESDQIQINFVHAFESASHNVELVIQDQTIVSQEPVLKALADQYPLLKLNGESSQHVQQIQTILSTLPASPPIFAAATAYIDDLDTKLTLRTFLISNQLTIADWSVWGAAKVNAVAQGLLKKGQHVHFARWFTYIDTLPSTESSTAAMFAASRLKAPVPSKDGNDKTNATFELGLPNAIKGHVITRFPPEPSGYLHIGHAKAAILNQFFAKHYEGKFLIRFDDTNPSKEKAEFEDSIVEDLALLGVVGDAVSHTSDFFDQLYTLCVKMISEGNAYADDTEQEQMRKERMDGIASSRRTLSPAECLARFEEMAQGTEEGQRWCIRAKISVDDGNKAMRDPVIYRGNVLPHHRTGTKYKVYPTYDFACPIVDALEGVTHALRTNEYRDRNPQYLWMLNKLGLRHVEVWDFGRVNFVYTLLSKRKLKWFVDEGYVRGWDDPRFPTVRGIRRRGMTIEALTDYMLMQGPSQAQTNLEWDSIWNLNKKVIDPIVPRYAALEGDLVRVVLKGTGVPTEIEIRSLPKHKKNLAVGNKDIIYSSEIYLEASEVATFALNEEITLMDWGNAFVTTLPTASSSDSIILTLNLTGDFKKTSKKCTWISALTPPTQPVTPLVLLDYDYLITKKKMMEEDTIEECLTPVTQFETLATADYNLRSLKKGETLQFEKKGYYIVDKAYGTPSTSLEGTKGEERVELILIPDGKAASTASKYVPSTATTTTTAATSKTPAASGGLPSKSSKPKSAPIVSRQLPATAPMTAQTTMMLSEGDSGFEMPVTTKMFRVPNVYSAAGEKVEAIAKTSMHVVKPVYDL